MSNDLVFRICNLAVIPGWVLLFAAPNWKWTQRIAAFILPPLLSALYVWFFIASFEGLHANYTSLGMVQWIFRTPTAMLAGWIHFLAFDLFVGAWIARDAQKLGILHLAVIPCLILTFVLGPAGLLLYYTLRAGMPRKEG